MESVKNLDGQIKDIKSIITISDKRNVRKVDGYNDDYMELAERLGNERVLAPKVEKKLKVEDGGEVGRGRPKKKEVREGGGESDEEDLGDVGVDGLRDGLSKKRKFRDNEEVKNMKDVKKMEKTLGF